LAVAVLSLLCVVANCKLTQDQRVFVLQNWRKHRKKSATVFEIVVHEFPDVEPPTSREIYELIKDLNKEDCDTNAELCGTVLQCCELFTENGESHFEQFL
jgi:hypothetical protein